MKRYNTNRILQMWGLALHLFLWFSSFSFGQQIIWAKLYALPQEDDISCITQDAEGNLYAGGRTQRLLTVVAQGNAIVYKLDNNGDTIYSKFIGVYGAVRNIVIDHFGFIHLAITQSGTNSTEYKTHLVTMTPDGFIFKRDTINKYLLINSGFIANDSSWVFVGHKHSDVTSGWEDMFFQRIRKDGTKEPYVSLNPGHPSCYGSRVEQLPNGKYLVSGTVGSRIATYTLDPDGSNPVYEQWYQTPNLNFMYSGHVGQAAEKKFLLGGQSSPCLVGLYDSLHSKIWLKKDTGVQVAPQAMTDGSILVGYSFKPTPPTKYFQRLAADSSTIWKLSFGDSLIARGYPGSVTITAFTSFSDESALLTGSYRWDGIGSTNTADDPFFMKIANVGTPVTSLTKPKKGTLTNETLAPWPNPTGGTLYLKQHFNQAEVHVYNMAGKEVGRYQMRFGQPIDVSGFESGVYLYRAVIDGKNYSGKIIKQ